MEMLDVFFFQSSMFQVMAGGGKGGPKPNNNPWQDFYRNRHDNLHLFTKWQFPKLQFE